MNEQNEKNSSLIGLALPPGGGSADRRYGEGGCWISLLASILSAQEVLAIEFAAIIVLLGKIFWRSNSRSPVFWLEMSAWVVFVIAVSQYSLAGRAAFEEKWQHRVSSRLNGNQVPQIDVVKDVGGLIASNDRFKADRKYFSPIPARADFEVVCGGGREFQATLYVGAIVTPPRFGFISADGRRLRSILPPRLGARFFSSRRYSLLNWNFFLMITKIRNVLLIFMAVLVAFFVGWRGHQWLLIDACLGKGGRWDSVNAGCTFRK